jgi:hypothetical protein
MRRLLPLATAVLVASTVAMVAPSLAGDISDEDTMVIDPTEGPPGTEIAVSGAGCATKGDVEVEVVLLDTEGVEQDSDVVTPSLDGFGGEWEAGLTVPADTTDFGDWTVDAACLFVLVDDVAVPAGRGPLVDYVERTFTVTEPAVQEPPAEPTPPPAAAPVAAAPEFTG